MGSPDGGIALVLRLQVAPDVSMADALEHLRVASDELLLEIVDNVLAAGNGRLGEVEGDVLVGVAERGPELVGASAEGRRRGDGAALCNKNEGKGDEEREHDQRDATKGDEWTHRGGRIGRKGLDGI